MKKNTLFFKTLGLFVTAMVSFSVVSCTKDDDAVSNDAIVGTWQWGSSDNDRVAKITFYNDNTIFMHFHGITPNDETLNWERTGEYHMNNTVSGTVYYTYESHDFPTTFNLINGKIYFNRAEGWQYFDDRPFEKQ